MKRILIGLGVIGGLCIATLLGNGCSPRELIVQLFAQDVVSEFDVNSPELETHVLIATQGSSFKEALVESLLTELEQPPPHLYQNC